MNCRIISITNVASDEATLAVVALKNGNKFSVEHFQRAWEQAQDNANVCPHCGHRATKYSTYECHDCGKLYEVDIASIFSTLEERGWEIQTVDKAVEVSYLPVGA